MKRLWKSSRKHLKSPRGCKFLKRETYIGELPKGWKQFRDHFAYERHDLVLQRITTTTGDGGVYVHWECLTLGGGNASPSYWFQLNDSKVRSNRRHNDS